MLIVGNVGSSFASDPIKESEFKKLSDFIKDKKMEIIGLSVEIESEIAILDEESKEMFLDEYGLKVSGLDDLITSSFK
jgi:hypothetical protein